MVVAWSKRVGVTSGSRRIVLLIVVVVLGEIIAVWIRGSSG